MLRASQGRSKKTHSMCEIQGELVPIIKLVWDSGWSCLPRGGVRARVDAAVTSAMRPEGRVPNLSRPRYAAMLGLRPMRCIVKRLHSRATDGGDSDGGGTGRAAYAGWCHLPLPGTVATPCFMPGGVCSRSGGRGASVRDGGPRRAIGSCPSADAVGAACVSAPGAAEGRARCWCLETGAVDAGGPT